MQTIRKSADGNIILVKRATGYAVSQRQPQWNKIGPTRLLGVQTLEWQTKASGLELAAATALFDRIAA